MFMNNSRAKWKCPATKPIANSSSKMLEKLSIATNSEEGPKKMKACVKLWQTDGVGTRLFFAPNGSAMAASGAHNSVQVCKEASINDEVSIWAGTVINYVEEKGEGS